MTSFRCQRCGVDYVVSDDKAGREPKCPRCSVPRRRPVAEVVEEDEPLPIRRAARGSWWRRLTPRQRSVFSLFFLVGALMLVCSGFVGVVSLIKPVPPQLPPVPQPKPWPPELVRDLDLSKDAVRSIVETDAKLRRELPRFREESVSKVIAEYGPNHLVTQLSIGEYDKEIRKRKAEWLKGKGELITKVSMALIALRRQHGWEDERLRQEAAKILDGLRPCDEPWPF